MKEEAEKLLKEISFLYQKYSDELRAATQPYQLSRIQDHFGSYKYNATDGVVRESLLEHVGTLPMLAIAFYPYINDPRVDLGQALIMLAIHDIGELVVGDVSTFKKKKEDGVAEYEAALSLLDPMYHDIYDQAEKKSNPTAKFAKAIDKIAPDILDYLTPRDLTIHRFKQLYKLSPEGIVPLIVEHKRPYMLWNPFMTEFHKLLMAELAAKLISAKTS